MNPALFPQSGRGGNRGPADKHRDARTQRAWPRKARIRTALALAAVVAAASALSAAAAPVRAPSPPQAEQVGTATGLPVPRYVSLRSDRVNLRQGPTKDHGTLWVYHKAGLPVEITAEFENWRRIRDSEGSEGWVLHSLLSGRRTALVAPWQKDGILELRDAPDAKSSIVAHMTPRVVASVSSCDASWCHISGKGFDGYIEQKNLWGVYPNERFK